MNDIKNEVAIVMGSMSDMDKMQGAIDILKEFKVSYEVQIVSAHRTPEYMVEFAKTAKSKGLKAIIAGAGGAAHLPGMVASLTSLPVIGVPVSLKNLDGMDSLLSIVQMPKGVPVACMAVDNSANAALFALRILGVSEEKISEDLDVYRVKQKEKVEKWNADLKN